MRSKSTCVLVVALLGACAGAEPKKPDQGQSFDVVVVGATPGGIAAAIAAARGGRSVALLDRNEHIGGLPANGLGATDITTRGATGGLFLEFVGRIRKHYADTYGETSEQVRVSRDGHHFEPSVAAKVFAEMLAEHPSIRVLRRRELRGAIVREGHQLTAVQMRRRDDGGAETYTAKVFVDATYEGDLAAAAGVKFRLGREAAAEFGEPMAGKIYKSWGTREPAPGTSGEGDAAVQAYNFRLCLTKDQKNLTPIRKPTRYDRAEFASLVEDVKLARLAGRYVAEKEFDGIGRLVNIVELPNGKTDSNNQHLAFISTDLPEENWPWPTADWAWRDAFADRLRDYTLGLLWFAQNDPDLPEDFRQKTSAWGLCKDEYVDNGNFPRQAYVREGRRIEGEHLFTAHDAIVKPGAERPPVYESSITASHYFLDSHAVRKREAGRVHLDGFFSHPSRPYTVPYGTIVPKHIDGLLVPVAASATHVGFSTLRMEPCWMALGQAAGVAAHLSIAASVVPRRVDVPAMQRELLRQKAVLIYVKDVPPSHPNFAAVQTWALRGLVRQWELKPDAPMTPEEAVAWSAYGGLDLPPGGRTRAQFLQALYDASAAPVALERRASK